MRVFTRNWVFNSLSIRNSLATLSVATLLSLSGTASALSPADDTDGDNMLDSWELANGFNPADPADADSDADSDGVPNKGEYHLGSDPNNGASLPAHTDNYFESFEGGTVPAPWFVPTNADAGWSISTTAVDGTYSIKSASIPYQARAEITLPIYVHYSDLDFRRFWNARSGDDFELFIDDVKVFDQTDLGRNWAIQPTVELTEGYHEIRFVYAEDETRSYGCKCTRIDSVQFTQTDVDEDGMLDSWELANGFNPADPSDGIGDADTDGLWNSGEFQAGTDPNNADSDGDGVSDGDEVNVYGSNPLDTDSDGDTLPDGWEVANALDPADAADAESDTDGDGVSAIGEYKLGTDPNDGGSSPPFTNNYTESFEGGVLPPAWSIPTSGTSSGFNPIEAGFNPISTTASDGSWSMQSASIPAGDAAALDLAIVTHLSDMQFSHYWNAKSGDYLEVFIDDELVYKATDLPRGWYTPPAIEVPGGYREIRFVYAEGYGGSYGCKCVRIDDIRFTQVDVDEDGMRDSWELLRGLDPANPNDGALDLDNDGLTNLEEYQYGTRPDRPDTDFDGLTDLAEINTYGTDPISRDSDGDLMNDDWEVAYGFDPLDAVDANLDLDADTYSNFVEYRLDSEPDNAGSVPAVTTLYLESFESTLAKAWYQPEGNVTEWSITSTDSSDGNRSLRSSQHTGSGLAYKRVELLLNTPEGELNIDHKHLTSNSTDWLRIYVDGDLWSQDYGNRPSWKSADTYQLEPGLHVIRFEQRRASGNFKTARALIDNLQFVAFDGDQDGMLDAWELNNGLDPLDPNDANNDNDGDGLTNIEEFQLGSKANSTDSDGDGLADIDEVTIYGTAPGGADSDQDGIDDGYEIANGLDPNNRDDGEFDADGDGVSNIAEFELGTDADDPASIPTYSDNYFESFEGPGLPAPWFVPESAPEGWQGSSTTGDDGSWALRSRIIDPGERAEVTLPILVHESELDFAYYWNANVGDDFLVWLDGKVIFQADSAPRGWTQMPTIRIPKGYHKLKFVYREDSFSNRGCKCVRIDSVNFTLIDVDLDNMPDDWELANGLNPADAADATTDLDSDGLNNLAEYQAGTDPNVADSDSDGLDDGAEVNTAGTDPLNNDSDADRLPDGWEVSNGLDPLYDLDANDDPDADTISNSGEYDLGTDPNVADPLSYNDNYSESFEGGVIPPNWMIPLQADDGWTINSASAFDGTYSLKSDGLVAGETAEIELGISTHLSDFGFRHYWNASSGDTLRVIIDGDEVYSITDAPRGWVASPVIEVDPGYHRIRFEYFEANNGSYGCKCVRIDSIEFTQVDADEDGMRDSWELSNGFDPADPADGALDSDSDGLTNAGEYQAETDLANVDSDADGLTDGDEVNILLTNPNSPDTDGDLLPDVFEVANGLDPRLPASGAEDSDGDGFSDVHEFRLGTSPDDGASTPPFLGDYVESFEGGVLDSSWYEPSGGVIEWAVSSDAASDGSFSLKYAGDSSGYKYVTKIVSVKSSILQLDRRGLGGNGNQSLVIYVDDEVFHYESGDDEPFDWTTISNDTAYQNPFSGLSNEHLLSEGSHEITFRYRGTANYDVWIDNIVLNELGTP